MRLLEPIRRQNLENLFIYQQDHTLSLRERALLFFKDVLGNDEIKENLYRILIKNDRRINVLLHGPASTSKTMLCNIIEKNCYDVIYHDATSSTGAGLIESLYNNRSAKVLIIDEITEMRKTDIEMLRGLLNSNRITKTLRTLRYDFTLPHLKIIATCNNISKLSVPIRSRFQEYLLQPYNDEQFKQILTFCLKRDNIITDPELADSIGDVLLHYNIRIIRKALSICNLIDQENDTVEDIQRVIENIVYNSASDNNQNFNIT